MATTPISQLVATIELVRTMKETLDGLVDVVEKLAERIERLEQGHHPAEPRPAR